MLDRRSGAPAPPTLRALAWLAGLLLLAAASAWPELAEHLAHLVAIAALFLLTGAAELLAQPPLLALAGASVAVVRLTRRLAPR